MQRAVAAVVGCAYVVLPLDGPNICLVPQHFRHPVNIVNISAYHPYVGNVIDAFPRRLDC